MSALLPLLGLVAGLVVYPAGLTLVACSAAALAVRAGSGHRAVGPGPEAGGGVARARMVGVEIALAGLAVAALPWPDSPLGAIPGVAAATVGSLGVPLTVAALWIADSIAGPPRPGLRASWAIGLLGCGVWSGSAGWPALLAHAGTGPTVLRLAAGAGIAVILPGLAGARDHGDRPRAVSWAAHSAIVTVLMAPTISRFDPVAAVALWAAVGAGLAAAHRLVARWRPAAPGREWP
ncbi:MAG TPA: hypothetical protein VMW47_04770 [Verrucomicrobiae bacterium]|nr:hypothetical protein [Verrucomicrobiae bacterium]